MRLTIEGASPEFERKLLALLIEHRHELTLTAGTEWTPDRAEHYLRSLPAAARVFARLVVEADGSKDADELREHFNGALRGPTIALSRAVPRGVRSGRWPEGTPAPIAPLYDPDNPSWQRAVRYEMAAEHLPAFREAFARLGT
ncbi:hypothetical protein ABZX30_15170 [Streptomyces sp. NPDC004542]|uniref:hypothetical protein n=1 Tax=Streptomyces sp. NPDC004542 TaxID=3154281 RepID=UPI0033AA101A